MGDCSLSKGDKNIVTGVVKNTQTGELMISLKEKTAKCPSGLFMSNGMLVRENIAVHDSAIQFDQQLHAPVLVLNSSVHVQKYVAPSTLPEAGVSFGAVFFWALLILGAGYLIRATFKSRNDDYTPPLKKVVGGWDPPPTPAAAVGYTPSADAGLGVSGLPSHQLGVAAVAQPVPVVIHEHHHDSGGGVNPVLAGVIGYELGRSANTAPSQTVVVERETVREVPYEAPSNSRYDREEIEEAPAAQSSSFSDDSSSSFSEPEAPSSSFESSSSSSFSDDSSSSFSSDSGSSFDSSSSSDFSSDS